jgi:hypothetical protein
MKLGFEATKNCHKLQHMCMTMYIVERFVADFKQCILKNKLIKNQRIKLYRYII